MNAHQKILLPDVQASQDRRNIVIQKVGVRSVTYPVKVEGAGGVQHSIATVDMYVRLPADVKGTHMSRFLEVLEEREAPLSAGGMRDLFEAMCARLESTDGEISMRMPYFVRKRAPVSGVESLLDYQLHLQAVRTDGVYSFTLGVQVPVTSLCPCSKKISDYGAHNQRSHIIINATLHDGSQMQPEELIAIAEESASCELWGLLKRPDEKYVTERAYDNPKFVEDLVRDIAMRLDGDDRISHYCLSSENFESIHNHSAYAWLEGPQRA